MTKEEHQTFVELWSWLFNRAAELKARKAAAGESLATDPAAACEPGKVEISKGATL